ncbi:phosphatidylserine decarboxylase proenzyme [Aspergillus udagawae]|uniref:Phosphatidylserine decarboxylase proenzyme n=1 Tax=Aspergillus udagawae TaxID=91492 RepID=A0ABQ1BE70_9EURO|nr:phosphatidylserine decarboxylase proenzyme [Aspergillus udagawae]GFF61063.1 phosphatidylserine decarboxylase proenzyme [Aspergillus udagawae]GFF99763.1 phosphatidylserine decarboxylase proenzyme [Aspergillus udagawae]
MPRYSDIVQELRDELLWEVDDLDQAVKNARKWDIPELDKYGIISAKGFLDFADWLVRGWVPTESTKGRDIYYILCVFYFVLSQEPLGGRQTRIHPLSINKKPKPLSDWVVRFAKEIGSSMDKPSSINEATITTFRNSPLFRVFESEGDSKNWTSFNKFFYRKLDKPREIEGPDNDRIVVFPADSTFAGAYAISDDSEVVLKKEEYRMVKDEVILKNVPWRVKDLLGKKIGDKKVPGDESQTYGDLFKDGLWTHVFLNSFDYHRQHAPVSGTVEEIGVIEGAAYLEVLVKTDEQVGHNYLELSRQIGDKSQNPSGVQTLDAPDTPGYQFLQTRGVVIINNENLGRVAVLPIGMAMVSSVNMREELKGQKIKKGDEISHFAFGGSDCIIMFEQKARVSGFPDSDPASREHFFYGEKLCRAYYERKHDEPKSFGSRFGLASR